MPNKLEVKIKSPLVKAGYLFMNQLAVNDTVHGDRPNKSDATDRLNKKSLIRVPVFGELHRSNRKENCKHTGHYRQIPEKGRRLR